MQQRNEVGPTLAKEVRIRKIQEALKGQGGIKLMDEEVKQMLHQEYLRLSE